MPRSIRNDMPAAFACVLSAAVPWGLAGCVGTGPVRGTGAVTYPVAVSRAEPVGNNPGEPTPPARRVPELSAAPLPTSPTDARSSYPLDLPTAMHLSNARPIDVQLAAQRIRAASAQLDQARS